jgi:PAS domain S-box-containing protein
MPATATAAAPARPGRPRDRSVRHHLAVFALALALPVTLFAGVLLWRFADTERARLEGQALAVARAGAVAVDRELAGLISKVEVVSLFSSLRAGDLQAFHAQARAVQERTGIDVVLRDPSGQHLVNTRRPWGEPLPSLPLPELDAEVLRTKRPVVSGLFRGAVARAPLFAVEAPVLRGGEGAERGEVSHLLGLSMPVERVRQALMEELASSGAPADWAIAVVDRAGLILARTALHEELVGRPATRDMLDATRDGAEGTWMGSTADGRAVFGAFARSRLSGWRVAVGVPADALAAPLRRSLLLLGALGAGLAGLSALLAALVGRRIGVPIRELAGRAAALGRGEAVAPLATPVREVNRVAAELGAAAASLGEREAALRRSEERFRLAATAYQGAVYDLDPATGRVERTPGIEAITGVGAEACEPTAEWWRGRVHPDDAERAWGEIARAIEGAASRYDAEYRVAHADGRWVRVRDTALVVRDAGGRPVRVVGSAVDVTARREAEAALRGNEARLRAILGTVPVGVVIAEGPSGRIVEGNKQAERIFGHPVLPSPDVESYREWVSRHPDGRRVAASEYPLARVVRGEAEQAELEVLYRRGDGREAWVRLLAAPIRDEAGRVAGGVVACLDVDREKRAEAGLRRLNEELESRVAERTAERDRMWRLSTDLMLVARFDRTIVAVNPAWTALLGWTEGELVGERSTGFLHPDDVERTLAETRRLSEGHTSARFENRYRHKDGSYRWLSWTGVPEGGFVHAVARDVTAEKAAQAELAEAQEQLRQAQKMEAVGQLTGGVAHDFNNLLQVILGSLDLLRRRVPDADERTRRSLQSAAEAAKRGAVLTARLLAFSRRQTLDPKPVEPNRLVAGMSDLLRRSLGEAVRVETVLAGGLWRACADPHQLENAILNLAVNARDAMPPEGGRLTVETANAHLDERYARDNPDVPAGEYVMIAVSDTGSGMSPEVASKAFDPFFTTKDVGQGTGLGLSQVYGFVKQSGGHVKIYSEPGEGTSVKIYLPRLREGGAAEAAPEAGAGRSEARSPPLPSGDGETVLVVEDEASVRRFTTEALRELGYRVLEADGARAALALLDAHGEGVDLLFTDVVMPEANGRGLADEALRRRPGLKVLFTTGYSRNAIIHNGVLDSGVQLIGKPFTVEELAAKLRAVLGRRAGQAAPGGRAR